MQILHVKEWNHLLVNHTEHPEVGGCAVWLIKSMPLFRIIGGSSLNAGRVCPASRKPVPDRDRTRDRAHDYIRFLFWMVLGAKLKKKPDSHGQSCGLLKANIFFGNPMSSLFTCGLWLKHSKTYSIVSPHERLMVMMMMMMMMMLHDLDAWYAQCASHSFRS